MGQVDKLIELHEARVSTLENEFETEIQSLRIEFETEMYFN